MPERFERVLRPVLRGMFHPASRYPADPRAVFVLALSVFTGLTALAVDAAPESLNAILPHWAVVLWGAVLTAGSAMTLVGMAKQTENGIVLEQVGSVVVGCAIILFYAPIALLVAGVGALQPVGVVVAWGLACFVRWIQLQLLLHDALRLQAKQIIEKQVGDGGGE